MLFSLNREITLREFKRDLKITFPSAVFFSERWRKNALIGHTLGHEFRVGVRHRDVTSKRGPQRWIAVVEGGES